MSSKARRHKLDIQQDQENPLVDDDIGFHLLPELFKMILTKAVLVQMHSKDTARHKSLESIFSNLASVDFRWWISMKNYNLRNKILRFSKVYLQRTQMRSTIIRNNLSFLKEVIDPDKIILPLESCGCLTEDQVAILRHIRNHKDKNHELLFMLQDSSSQKYSKLIDCLFRTNQTPAALVLERGGEAVKVHINNGKPMRTKEFEIEIIERFQRMQTENTLILNDLLTASVFILHVKQNKGIEMWFWCKTESSLNQMKSLSDDDLQEIIQRIYQQLIPEHKITLKPQLIQMDYSLGSDFVERRLAIRHVGDNDNLPGFGFFRSFGFSQCATSLANKVYVVQENEISVYSRPNKYSNQSLKSTEFFHVFHFVPDILTMILTNAALVQMYCGNNARREGITFFFCGLASVNSHWWKSMKTSNFKTKSQLLTKVYFQRAKMRSTIIRNNRNFLKEVMDPDKIIFQLESWDCLTVDQTARLNRLRNHEDKNHELLLMLQDFSFQNYSKFIEYLFATNQTPAALVLERGGGALKVHINNGKETWIREFEMELIERFRRMQTENTLILDDLLNASVEGILNDVRILHAKQNNGIELWFWCKTESSLNQMKKSTVYEALKEVIQRMYQRLIPEHGTLLEPRLIQMAYPFANAFAERQPSIRHMKYCDNLTVYGFSKCVTSFEDKIYIAQESRLLVYNNKFPYESLESIVFRHQPGLPTSIASCNVNKCLYISTNVKIYKVEPEFDKMVSVWMNTPGFLFIISVTNKGDILVLKIEGGDNELRIFTHEGAIKHTISMDDRFIRARFIQEIMPDIVAVSYSKPRGASFTDNFSFIAIMRLDENGTILHNFGFPQEIVGLSCIRFCGLLTAVSVKYKEAGDSLFRRVDNFYKLQLRDESFGLVWLNHWPLQSKVIGTLLRTDEKIYSIHFAADQKQLYVLSSHKLHIYQLNYEDEDYDRKSSFFVDHIDFKTSSFLT